MSTCNIFRISSGKGTAFFPFPQDFDGNHYTFFMQTIGHSELFFYLCKQKELMNRKNQGSENRK